MEDSEIERDIPGQAEKFKFVEECLCLVHAKPRAERETGAEYL